MTNRDGEDVCGCKMAAIDCIIVSALLEANGLTNNYDRSKDMAENKKIPKAGSTTTVDRPASDMMTCQRIFVF